MAQATRPCAAADRLYDYCLVLDWNISPRRRGRGSAIFFHLARPGFTPTQGCVAVTAKVMARLLPYLSDRTVLAGVAVKQKAASPPHKVREKRRGLQARRRGSSSQPSVRRCSLPSQPPAEVDEPRLADLAVDGAGKRPRPKPDIPSSLSDMPDTRTAG